LKNRPGPVRTCLGCRARAGQAGLVRLALIQGPGGPGWFGMKTGPAAVAAPGFAGPKPAAWKKPCGKKFWPGLSAWRAKWMSRPWTFAETVTETA